MNSIEKLLFQMYRMKRQEKMKTQIPEHIEPLHEEIFRSLQTIDENTTPRNMSIEAILELMRIVNLGDKVNPLKDIVCDEILKLTIELVNELESSN